jgi:hypothetical protein
MKRETCSDADRVKSSAHRASAVGRVLAFSLIVWLTLTDRGNSQEILVMEEKAEGITRLLNNLAVIADLGANPTEAAAYRVRLFRVSDFGECAGTPESCPTEYVYVAVSEWGEYPEQKLFRLPDAYGWEFESADELPRRPSRDSFVTFRLKRKVVAADITKAWWEERCTRYASISKQRRCVRCSKAQNPKPVGVSDSPSHALRG